MRVVERQILRAWVSRKKVSVKYMVETIMICRVVVEYVPYYKGMYTEECVLVVIAPPPWLVDHRRRADGAESRHAAQCRSDLRNSGKSVG